MKTNATLPHKLGANRNELAQKPRKHAGNFSQSRDVREDRGARQEKFAHQPHTGPIRPTQNQPVTRSRRLLLPERSTTNKRRVVVNLSHPSAKKVTIAGTFNQWHPESTPLRQTQPGEWTAELFLEADVYQYRFLVDDEWEDDPNGTGFVPNGFGGQNSLLEVNAT